MAKSVQLTPSKPAAPAPVAAPRAAPPPTQPAAREGLPIATGVPLRGPTRLLPEEAAELRELGIDPDQPLPANLAELVAAAKKIGTAERLAPPVDPATPPVQLKTVPLATTNADTRARIGAALAASIKDAQEEAAEQARLDAMPAVARKVSDALQTRQDADAPPPPLDRPPPPFDPATGKPSTVLPPPAPAGAAPAPHEHVSGAGTAATTCQHCGMSLSQPSIPEPPVDLRAAFVQCLLGQVPFSHEYKLYGSQLRVIFRALTWREIEEILKQCKRERERGELRSVTEFLERSLRLQFCLQLAYVGHGNMTVELPDGLSMAHNPRATAVWGYDEKEVAEPLLAIEQHVLSQLPDASVQIVLYNTCMQFNQLRAKLEVMKDNPDFMKATA